MTEQQQYPTREQIVAAWVDARQDQSIPRQPNGAMLPIDAFEAGVTAGVALFPQPTPSAEARIDVVPVPRAWLERLIPTLHKHADAAMIETADRALDGTIARMTAQPPSIAYMAPGTELTADYFRITRRVRVIDPGGVWLRGIDDESLSVRADDLDPSTIRDVTPPLA